MSEHDRLLLRTTFDAVAERYDRIRPHYPSLVFDEIGRFARLEPGSRILEVGCGTGQATVELARGGHTVVAVEMGANLAAIARRRLAGHPTAEVIVADFDRWQLPSEPFEALVSASAFHWIDPTIRYAKAADALRPGGALAIIDVDHVIGGTEQFFLDVVDCYARWDPGNEDSAPPPPTGDIPTRVDEIESSGRFGPVTLLRFEVEHRYSTADYLDLLMTNSRHLMLEAKARTGLLDCVGTMINGRHGGWVTKRDVVTLRLARRRT